MWKGGVRVIVLDEENKILMVKHHHPERDVWMVPGGSIEAGENSFEAGIREVKEETGLDITMNGMLYHVEETGERGQRFVNFFLARPLYMKDSVPRLGVDPELAEDEQVLADVQFMTRDEVMELENVYPEWLKDELWNMLDDGSLSYNAFRKRTR